MYKKIKILIYLSPRVGQGSLLYSEKLTIYVLRVSVLFFVFLFLSLFTWDISPFITIQFSSQPSTWRAVNLPLDTCPILALLVVVE